MSDTMYLYACDECCTESPPSPYADEATDQAVEAGFHRMGQNCYLCESCFNEFVGKESYPKYWVFPK